MRLDARARRAGWVAMGLILLAMLVVGATGQRGARTSTERLDALARTIACPQCSGESIAESRAPIAVAMKEETARFIEQGRTDAEIRAYWASRYGQEVILIPPAGGVGGLVWALPVVGLVCALAGLVVVFRRWRVTGDAVVTDADRALVEEALRRERSAG